MDIRYIFNTSGEYSAFIYEGHLYNPNSHLLGYVMNGNEVFNTRGQFIGEILNDDRIVRNSFQSKPGIIPPLPQLPPLPPLPPLPRLRMLEVPEPYVDVFENSSRDIKSIIPNTRLFDFSKLVGSKILADDGTFLGIISLNKYDTNSISNIYGDFGSKYSQKSIFNTYGTYGSKYSAQSPFNQYSNIPPKIYSENDNFVGYLTVNHYWKPRIDTYDFIDWFDQQMGR